ncbi:MAG: DNA gyrase subunit A [Patescibacteria group bacterium]|jgi:DNA gyrase subunit A
MPRPKIKAPNNKKQQEQLPLADQIGKIENRSITEEIQESFLDYAMSVIIDRALPDVRDGMKPVHRRILYAMWNMGLKAGSKFRKSATVVGEVLGKYHPHGDAAVYETLVRLAQDFSLRYPLVWGQGNFGSLDGDSAAAMRYTECKLASISDTMLADIDKDTVPFGPNYDGSLKEPHVLPALLPNLLLNGTVGIAVGMATNIPPHNLSELCDAIARLLDQPDCTVEDLMEHVKGPDLPTGGIIYDQRDIAQTYATGKGGIVMRAKTEIIEEKAGHFRIIVHEIPYQVNKATLLEKIADLVQEKKIDGIKDLRDESSKEGVRIVIDLKRDAYPKKVLNRLFLLTQLQETLHVNMLALVDGIQPRILNLKAVLEYYIEHRRNMVKKRTEFDLARAEERAHILKGLKIALDHLDAVIKTIRASQDKDEAKANLIKKFKLSEAQATAILEMRLQALANMERRKVEDELKEKLALIKDLEAIVRSPKKITDIVKKETLGVKDKYGDERRTEIVAHGVKDFSAEDLIPNEPTIVLITADGYIKRLPPDTFRTQERGGKGVAGVTTKEADVVEHLFTTTTHADLFFFTSRGRVFQLKAYDVPQASRVSKGQALVNFLQLAPNEKVSAVLSGEDFAEHKFLFMATRQGTVKKVPISDFSNVRRNGLIAVKLHTEDVLEWIKPATGTDEAILVTAAGQAVRFKEKDVRPMGRAASGVRGIRLKNRDCVVGMDVISPDMAKAGKFELLVVMANGFGKRTNLTNYKIQGRGGSGIKTAKVTDKTGKIVMAMVVNAKEERDLLAVSDQGQVIRVPVGSISVVGRDTQGVRIMRFKEEKDGIASVTLV